jgi:hypothetical protein
MPVGLCCGCLTGQCSSTASCQAREAVSGRHKMHTPSQTRPVTAHGDWGHSSARARGAQEARTVYVECLELGSRRRRVGCQTWNMCLTGKSARTNAFCSARTAEFAFSSLKRTSVDVAVPHDVSPEAQSQVGDSLLRRKHRTCPACPAVNHFEIGGLDVCSGL